MSFLVNDNLHPVNGNSGSYIQLHAQEARRPVHRPLGYPHGPCAAAKTETIAAAAPTTVTAGLVVATKITMAAVGVARTIKCCPYRSNVFIQIFNNNSTGSKEEKKRESFRTYPGRAIEK
jgi:hypothetical protein